MKGRLAARLLLLLGLLAALGVLAVACGGGGEDEATTVPSRTGGAVSPTGGALKLGAAGIASKPRALRGLDSWKEMTQSLDDGLAIWKTRPANENRTGITSDTIKLGQSAFISGPIAGLESCWGPMEQALIKRINEAGGIHGRKIQYIKYDDQYNPAIVVTNIKKLVEQDKIFATFFSENTPGHQATREYLQEQRVLELFPTDNDVAAMEPPWPYYTGVVYPLVFVGGGAYADYVKANYPNAKVGILTVDASYAVFDRDSFVKRAQDIGLTIVSNLTHPVAQTDLTSQAQQLVSAGSNVIVLNPNPTSVPNFLRALRQVVGSNVPVLKAGLPTAPEFSQLFNGVVNGTGSKTPQTNPDMPLWNQLAQVGQEEKASWCPAQSGGIAFPIEGLVRALEAAGPDPTREGVLEALKYAFDGYMCGICIAPIYLNYTDTAAYEAMQFYRWDGTANKGVFVGEPLSFETSKGKGVRGNDPKYTCDIPPAIKALNLPNYPASLCPWR